MAAAAFKVRLEDGMEVGPLDGEMLRSWYQQGLIKRTPRGRVITERGFEHLGLPVPERAASLF